METVLAGGHVSQVRRRGATVSRDAGPWTPAVHALLRHFEAAGFDGAPRVLGLERDPAGGDRELLSFVDGDVAAPGEAARVAEAGIGGVGRLLRRMHAASAGFELPPGVAWAHPPGPGGPPAVVCHNDVSPANTVFRDGEAVAFIDWDLAAPGAPAWDLAQAAWQFVPLVADDGCAARGWPVPPDRPARLRALADAYGLPAAERPAFPALVARRMTTTLRGIEALARAGEPAFRRLAAQGVPDGIRAERAWVRTHERALRAALG